MKRYQSVAGFLLLIAVVAGLAAGCSNDQTTPVMEPQADSAASGDVASISLAGTSWALASMGEGESKILALDDLQPTLGFLADRYGGDSGCNYYMGVYSTSGPNVVMETPARTGGMCSASQEVQGQESAYMSSLATVTSYAIVDNMLEMYSSGDQLMLTMRQMDPAPLQQTVWLLQFVNAETQWQPIIPGSEITMQISDGKLSGTAGCNQYTANVSESAGALTIEGLAATEMACMEPAGVMEQEQLYLSLLGQAALIRQFPVSLELLDKEGAPLLLYGAAE